MTDRPVKIGSISAQILALMLTDEHYKDRLRVADGSVGSAQPRISRARRCGAPLVQIEEPAIHQVIADPNQTIKPEKWVEAFNVEVKGLRDKCEVWCHTCWGSPAAQRVASKDQSYKAALPYLDQLDVDVLTVEGAFNSGMDLEHFGKMISKNKKIALGVISHRTLQVERPEEVADLIRRALEAYRAGAADPDQRLRLRPPVDEPDARILQDGRARCAARTSCAKELGLPRSLHPGADAKLSMVPMAKG